MNNPIKINKDNLIKNFIKIQFYILLFIVCKYSLDIIISIYNIIKENNLNNFLNEYVRVLQNEIFFGSFIYLFNKSMKSFLWIIPIAFTEVKISFLSTYIAPLLLNSQSNISPEYIRIILFIFILIVYGSHFFTKKTTIIKIFLTLSMLGVLVTAVLFHIITTKQLDFYTNSQESEWKKSIETNKLDDICIIQEIECKEIINDKIPYDFIEKIYNNIRPYMDKQSVYFYYFIGSDNSFSQSRIFSRKPVALIKLNNHKYFMLDKIHYTKYLKFNEIMFGILALSSHLVWIFGSFYLIYFHKKRKLQN